MPGKVSQMKSSPGGRLLFVFLIWLSVFCAVTSCIAPPASPVVSPSPSPSATSQAIPTYSYQIINVFPHDPQAFTEGLVWGNGFLYEGTGLQGRSSLRRTELTTGKVLQIHNLPAEYFGEGITLCRDTLIQLTWQSHLGFVYNKSSFDLLRDFSYLTEGWGLTFDGSRLIMSDGTSVLYFRDPVSLDLTGTLQVKDNRTPVDNINELEYVNGKIYANIWQTDKIAIIDPQTGIIAGWIDLSGLLKTQIYSGQVDVLNGIAYDAQADRLFVTGKFWPFLFEIKLVAK
jgi:glutaminyl-peptide cyclotransferase